MELFFSRDIEGGICRLDHDESGHCIKVLRHRCGDEISVIDGCGTLYRCRITSDSHKGVEAMVLAQTARVEKILVSAAKQSLKASVPVVNEPVSVKEFIKASTGDELKLIAYCFEDENVPRRSIKEVLDGFDGTDVIVMIGPEGDFSQEEAVLALNAGFIPVHLGASRLRTETAAVTAASAAYFRYMD